MLAEYEVNKYVTDYIRTEEVQPREKHDGAVWKATITESILENTEGI